MNPKVFKPLPVIDFDYERRNIIYYPPSWSKPTPVHNRKTKPNRKYITVRNRIRVNRLNSITTLGDLHERFSYFGAIASISTIKMVRNNYNNQCKEGHSYITFFLEEDAKRALKSSVKFLNGSSIFVEQAIQEPENVDYTVKPMNRKYSMHTLLLINDKYKNIFLKQDVGTVKKNCYTLIKTIDPNMPKNMKRSTILDPDSDSESSSTSLDDVGSRPVGESNPLLQEQVPQSHPVGESNPLLQEQVPQSYPVNESNSLVEKQNLELIPVVPENSVSIIDNGSELNTENVRGLDNGEFNNFVYPNPIYIEGDLTYYQDPNYLNYRESEYPLDSSNAYYYDQNQIIYDPILQHSQVVIHQNDAYYDLNNEYSIPEENINYDPYYVDPSMYQDALVPVVNLNAFQTEYNYFYENSPTVYATFHEYGMNNQWNVQNQFADLPDSNYIQALPPQPMNLPACAMHEFATGYQYYNGAQIVDLAENHEIEMSMMQINNGTFEVSNLIEQPIIPPTCDTHEYEMDYQYYNDEHLRDLAKCDDIQMPVTQENDVTPELPELVEQQMISPACENHTLENDDPDYEEAEIIDLTEYDDLDMFMIPEDDSTPEFPRVNPYQQYSATFDELLKQLDDLRKQMRKSHEADKRHESQSTQCNENDAVEDANNLFMFPASDSVDGTTVKIEQLQNCDIQECSTSNQSNFLQTAETLIEPSTSTNKKINQNTSKSEIKSKIPDKAQDKSKIIDESSKCGFSVVSVRDVATQFPEHGANSINTTPEVGEASLQNMETQTLCTPENANKETTPLRLTFANATKRSKRKN